MATLLNWLSLRTWKNKYIVKRGKKTIVHYTVMLRKRKSLILGSNVKIKHHAMLKGRIIVGDNTDISAYVVIKANKKSAVTIGNNCLIREFSYLDSIGGIKIGNNVRLSHHVSLIASTHHFERTDIPFSEQGMYTKGGITIGDDVLIGAGAKVLDGVTIDNGAIIGTSAVVTHNVKTHSIVGGIPAREINVRGRPKTNLLKAQA